MTNINQSKRKFIVKIGYETLVVTVFAAILANFLNPAAVYGAGFNENSLKLAYLPIPILSQFVGLKNLFDKAEATEADSEEITSLPESGPRAPDNVVKAVITAYTSTVDQCDDDPFIAASGKRVYDGMIAANWLPMGTKVKIPDLYGDKIFTVDDRMNSRYGFGRMDIWLDATKAEARKFGVKRVKVEVYYTYDK